MAEQKCLAEANVGCDHPLLVLGTFLHPVPGSAELELHGSGRIFPAQLLIATQIPVSSRRAGG